MGIKIGNLIIGGNVTETSVTPPEVKPVENDVKPMSFSQIRQVTETVVQEQIQKEITEEVQEETHIKLLDGELERLIPKKSSYMMDFTSGSE